MTRWSTKEKRKHRQATRAIEARERAHERYLDRKSYWQWKNSTPFALDGETVSGQREALASFVSR